MRSRDELYVYRRTRLGWGLQLRGCQCTPREIKHVINFCPAAGYYTIFLCVVFLEARAIECVAGNGNLFAATTNMGFCQNQLFLSVRHLLPSHENNKLMFQPLLGQISAAPPNMSETLACVLHKYDVYMACVVREDDIEKIKERCVLLVN